MQINDRSHNIENLSGINTFDNFRILVYKDDYEKLNEFLVKVAKNYFYVKNNCREEILKIQNTVNSFKNSEQINIINLIEMQHQAIKDLVVELNKILKITNINIETNFDNDPNCMDNTSKSKSNNNINFNLSNDIMSTDNANNNNNINNNIINNSNINNKSNINNNSNINNSNINNSNSNNNNISNSKIINAFMERYNKQEKEINELKKEINTIKSGYISQINTTNCNVRENNYDCDINITNTNNNNNPISEGTFEIENKNKILRKNKNLNIIIPKNNVEFKGTMNFVNRNNNNNNNNKQNYLYNQLYSNNFYCPSINSITTNNSNYDNYNKSNLRNISNPLQRNKTKVNKNASQQKIKTKIFKAVFNNNCDKDNNNNFEIYLEEPCIYYDKNYKKYSKLANKQNIKHNNKLVIETNNNKSKNKSKNKNYNNSYNKSYNNLSKSTNNFSNNMSSKIKKTNQSHSFANTIDSSFNKKMIYTVSKLKIPNCQSCENLTTNNNFSKIFNYEIVPLKRITKGKKIIPNRFTRNLLSASLNVVKKYERRESNKINN